MGTLADATIDAPLEAKLKAKFSVKHICKDGARYHVHSYGLYQSRTTFESFAVTWCSEPFCEDNLHAIQAIQENGLDPVRCCPSVAAKEWLKDIKS